MKKKMSSSRKKRDIAPKNPSERKKRLTKKNNQSQQPDTPQKPGKGHHLSENHKNQNELENLS